MSFKDYDGEPTNVREHQDAYEFFTRLQVCQSLCCCQQACLLMYHSYATNMSWGRLAFPSSQSTSG